MVRDFNAWAAAITPPGVVIHTAATCTAVLAGGTFDTHNFRRQIPRDPCQKRGDDCCMEQNDGRESYEVACMASAPAQAVCTEDTGCR